MKRSIKVKVRVTAICFTHRDLGFEIGDELEGFLDADENRTWYRVDFMYKGTALKGYTNLPEGTDGKGITNFEVIEYLDPLPNTKTIQ